MDTIAGAPRALTCAVNHPTPGGALLAWSFQALPQDRRCIPVGGNREPMRRHGREHAPRKKFPGRARLAMPMVVKQLL